MQIVNYNQFSIEAKPLLKRIKITVLDSEGNNTVYQGDVVAGWLQQHLDWCKATSKDRGSFMELLLERLSVYCEVGSRESASGTQNWVTLTQMGEDPYA